MTDDFDARLRREAQAWLTVRTHDGQVSISREDLRDFAIDGRRIGLVDRHKGIRKPRELAAALSILTTYTVDGGVRPYEDAMGPDGLLRYKWRGEDPLNEVDGPMLEHGLKRRHGQPLMALPTVRAERPDRELLDRRYTRFRTAG